MSLFMENIKSDTYPFVKWVGGKRQLLDDLWQVMPTSYNRYFEPFIGGGALYFELQPTNAYIADLNIDLINLYLTVRDNVQELIENLKNYRNTKEDYLLVRDWDRTPEYNTMSNVQKAGRFIYLNRTCFNGLFRVNSRGEFNVPYGRYVNPKILDEKNLLNCSRLLKTATIKHADFSEILACISAGDFVYFDPPYIPLNPTSSFTSYTKEGFGLSTQKKLRDLCIELSKRNVKFLLSNSDTEITRELYSQFSIQTVYASRQINANAQGRGKITELLVRNY